MIWAFTLIAVLLIFHRELIYGFLILFWRPQAMNAGVAGRGSNKLILLERKNHADGWTSFGCLFGMIAIVDSELWDSWSIHEKEAVVLWSYAIHKRSFPLFRLVGILDILGTDRDAILMGAKPTDLISLLESIKEWRSHHSVSDRSMMTGLSPLGPSWMLAWPSLQERLQSLTQVGGKLL